MGRRGRSDLEQNTNRRYAGARKKRLPICTKQGHYESREDAARALLGMNTNGDRQEAQAYYCREHDCWHLTKKQRF